MPHAIAAAFCLGAIFSAGFAAPVKASGKAPAKPLYPASAERGESVYLKACIACHGEDGGGNGPAARYLDPLPRNFTTGMFKFRSTPSGELPTDADLLRVVEDGVSGTQMPPWKDILTAQERADVVAYLKLFSEDFRGAAPPPPLAVPEPPQALAKWAPEGKMIYMLMECWACHGGKGKGDGKSGKTLTDDWGKKILPWNLTRYQYKAGHDARALYRTFSTGLNGTPMPAYALDGFLIGGNTEVDPAKYREAYSNPEIDALKSWLATQPTDSEIGRMSDAGKAALGERRKWALVSYIQSLVHKPNYIVRIFTEDTETTP
jgi:cytochrome c oxidase cbb3-type subunit 2